MLPSGSGRWSLAALWAAGSILSGCTAPSPPAPPLDLLIAGGEMLDGTGAPGRRADVGIRGDRIAFIGDARATRIRATRTVDAAGLLVAPGFIDPHTHSADDLASDDRGRRRRAALNHVMQGVTTIFVGNDGGGSPGVARQLARFAELGTGVNVATFIGFGPVRRQVVGEGDRAASRPEVEAMAAMIARGMCEGALGFSTGLYYAPQSFAKTDEVIALASEAASRGGVYESHLRDEGSDNIGLIAAVDEAIRIGREARLPVHIAHIKALGVDVHGQAPRVIERVEAARASGLRVTADQYPWSASGTRLTSALMPRWAMDGGRDALQRRFEDPAVRTRLRAGMADNLRRRGGGGSILIIGGSHVGKRLDAVAGSWNTDPVSAAVRIMTEEGDAPIASFNMAEADIQAFARRPWVAASSDAVDGHPRRFGSFAERWRKFVRSQPLLTPAEFVHRASGLTASIFAIEGRGTLRVGALADVTVFDPAHYVSKADYDDPAALAEGVHTVLVNGQLAVENGRPTRNLSGRPIAKRRDSSSKCPT
jgi:N-acyl-D-aspartate/D-glutamate deacylase